MQILHQIQLSISEVQRLKSWLGSSDAELFVQTLRARSYIATLEAGELLKTSMLRQDNQEIQAKGKAAEAGLLDNMIDEMNKVANDESLMVKLSSVAALPPEQPTETQ